MLILFGVISLVFILFTILPGDPARMMLGQRDDENQLKAISQKFAFDKPYHIQYLLYLNDLSILSMHSKEKNSFTNLNSKQYRYTPLFSTQNYDLVLKRPYLRTSFKKTGKPVSKII